MDVLPRRGWKKGRQILTRLRRKTHAEAKQQDLSQLCTVKYCVQLVHSWTDVLGLVYFLLPLHSYLCALNTGGWLLHLSAFALLFPLHYLHGKLSQQRKRPKLHLQNKCLNHDIWPSREEVSATDWVLRTSHQVPVFFFFFIIWDKILWLVTDLLWLFHRSKCKALQRLLLQQKPP